MLEEVPFSDSFEIVKPHRKLGELRKIPDTLSIDGDKNNILPEFHTS